MHRPLPIALVALCLLPVAAEAAPCTTAGTAGAAVKPAGARTPEGARIVVSMALLPRLLKLDSGGAARSGSRCERGRFAAAPGDYLLVGENGDRPAVRRALPARGKGPIAVLLPITDIQLAIAASQAKQPAPSVDGFLLATLDGRQMTGWRYYAAVPDDAALLTDAKAALDATLPRIFRTDLATGKVELFVG